MTDKQPAKGLGLIPWAIAGLGIIGAAIWYDSSRGARKGNTDTGRPLKPARRDNPRSRMEAASLPVSSPLASVRPAVSKTIEAYGGSGPETLTAVDLVEKSYKETMPPPSLGQLGPK